MLPKKRQDALTAVVLKGGKLNRKCVGRDAKTLLGMIGVTVPIISDVSHLRTEGASADRDRAYDADFRCC